MAFLRQFREVLMFTTLFYFLSDVQANNKTLLCYFETDVLKTSDVNRYLVEDIDPSVCTHLVYCRVRLDIENKEINKLSEVLKKGNVKEKIAKLKTKNPNLKVLTSLALKPSDLEPTHIHMLENGSYVDALAKKTVEFLKKNNFDGVTLKFNPGEGEQLVFLNFINALKKEFLNHDYDIVYVELAYWTKHSSKRMDFPSLAKNLDFVVLDTFNFHDAEMEPRQAAHHVPLYNQPWDREKKSDDSTVNYWINKGFPPEKILLGLSLLGHSWTLSSDNITPPAPAKSGGPPGKYTIRSGFLGYFELCQDVKQNGWQVIQDPSKSMGPYAVSPAISGQNRIWVSYDDPAMATIKSEYILTKGLGGAAVKDISYDDHLNKCGEGRNPMLTAIRKTLTPEWTPGPANTATTVSIPSLFLFVLALLLPKHFQVV